MDELADKTLKFIGLMKEKDDGLEAYVNLVITVKDGKIVDLERLPAAYDNSGAINEATAWVDTNYWNR